MQEVTSMNATKVGVFGVSGKMGSQVVTAVEEADSMVFTGGSDLEAPREAIKDAQVVVDLSLIHI